MVLLQRAQHGCLLTSIICFMAFLDFSIIVAGVLMISMVFVLQTRPNFSPGCLIIFLGFDTIATGATGMKRRSNRLCHIINVTLASVSAFGSAVLSLFLFSNRSKAIHSFHSTKYSAVTMDNLFWSLGWAFLFLFVAEILVISFGFLIRRYSPIESYETVEETRQRRALALGQMWRDLTQGTERSEARQAKTFGTKMKDKYGKWSHEQWR